MSDAPSFWTHDRFGQLCGMWTNTKLSAKQIGQVLGCSKNSIMGMVHRAREKDLLPFRIELKLYERPPHPLLEVGARECRWPIGHPIDPDFHFCRARVETEGRSYCDMHHEKSVRRIVVDATTA